MESFYSYIDDIKQNDEYRKILYTVPDSMQIVAMSLKPGQTIPKEVHPYTTQFFYIVEGIGSIRVNDTNYVVTPGFMKVVPPGLEHEVINMSDDQNLKLLTIYTPPEH